MGIFSERSQCTATWSISTTVNLQSASCSNTRNSDQNLVDDVYIAAEADFLSMLAEYISPAGANVSPSLVVTAVGAMLWARITSLVGYECVGDPGFDVEWNMQRGGWYFASDQSMKTVATMKCSWLLFAIIAIHPVLVVMLTLLKAALLCHFPITDGFGLITLLAGLADESRYILARAELSGKLPRPVQVSFGGRDVVEKELLQEIYC